LHQEKNEQKKTNMKNEDIGANRKGNELKLGKTCARSVSGVGQVALQSNKQTL
jgi:hypothetical protein